MRKCSFYLNGTVPSIGAMFGTAAHTIYTPFWSTCHSGLWDDSDRPTTEEEIEYAHRLGAGPKEFSGSCEWSPHTTGTSLDSLLRNDNVSIYPIFIRSWKILNKFVLLFSRSVLIVQSPMCWSCHHRWTTLRQVVGGTHYLNLLNILNYLYKKCTPVKNIYKRLKLYIGVPPSIISHLAIQQSKKHSPGLSTGVLSKLPILGLLRLWTVSSSPCLSFLFI